MLRSSRARWSMRAGLLLLLPVLALAAAGSIAVVRARAGSESPEQTQGNQSAQLRALGSAATGGASVAAIFALEDSPKTEDRPHASRLLLPRRSTSAARATGSDAWYLGLAVVAALLAAAGGIAFAGRRFGPRPGAGALHVVSRVSLSPKHAVYLLRAGGRVLLVGTGPQGAPTLISELDEVPPIEPAPGQGEES
jgi:flagellar biogenesis protein FliO